MTEMEQMELKHIKICLLGSEKVGKTYLAHKLVDLDYQDYQQVSECQKFIKQLADKKEILIYYDFPPIRNDLIEELTRDHIFDMMVCLFKDSTSFGQLYEFFESISKKTEENNHKFNSYWESIKNIILVYSDFDDKGQAQLEELFNILTEEIRNFNRTATIKQFVLKPQLANHQYLRYLIEKNRFQEHFSDKSIPSDQQFKRQNEKNVEDMIKEVASIDNFDNIHQKQAVEGPRQPQDGEDQIPELTEIKLTSTKEKLLGSEDSIQETDHIETLGNKGRSNNSGTQMEKLIKAEEIQISQQASHQQGIIAQEMKQDLEKDRTQLNIATKSAEKVQKEVVVDEQQKEKQHYRQVFNRLLEKINSEEIEASKKTSYKDLFEEFRRTSKDQSKITKQLKQYWQHKIERLQEEEDDDQDEEPRADDYYQEEEYRYESKQEKPPQSADSHHYQKKHGEPLKPQSNYLDGGKPRRQKSTADSNTCFCEII